MIQRLTITLILVAGIIVGTGTAAPAAWAAETQGYQISPPVTTLALDPGTSTRQTVKVTNLTDTQMTLQISKRNFVAKGEEGEVELTDDANPLYSLSPYFTLSQPTIDVPPKATREISYTISVPLKAEPGGRYGSIVFNTIAAKLPTGQSGASVRQELAALVFLRINGQAHEQLTIDSFTPAHAFAENGPVAFATRLHNLGNVHEKPTGEIIVKNMLGLKTATIKLDEKNIIPGAVRRFDSTLKRKWLLGRYTADLTVHNGSLQTLTARTTFTVIPYKLIALLLIGLTLVLLFFFKARRRLARAARILAGKE